MNARKTTRRPLAARRQAVVSNALESLETRRLMANLTVTSNADSGAGSLRDAIQTANASLGDDVINFNIAGANKRITLASALPTITGKTVIDGTTQPGYVAGSSTMVEIRPGTAPDGTNGLVFSSNGGTVRGMMINAFKLNFQTKAGGNGVVVEHGAKNITIEKNYIGTNGSVGIGNAGHGVLMYGSDSVIRDNVVANNFKNGITLSGFQANNNLVAGNNTVPLMGNAVHGIAIVDGAWNNTVGGTTAADRNVLSWNKDSGVFIGTVTEGAIASSQNRVIGNWIGLDNAGTTARGNYLAGVKIVGGSDNVVGGSNAGEGNLISGNGKFGVVLHGTDSVKLLGNQIGANSVGDHTPNLDHGIEVAEYAHGVQIGGPTSGERNWVSVATGKYGVRVGDGADTTTVRGNVIGYTATGKAGPGAESIGVSISNFGNGVVVGGPSASEGNVIANVDTGIQVSDATPTLVIENNRIGLNLAGTAATASKYGIACNDGSDVRILNNTIGGQSNAAIRTAAEGVIQGNRIGLDVSGLNAVSVQNGVEVSSGVRPIIGGTLAGQGNIIGRWLSTAISVTDTYEVPIQGNRIGLNVEGGKIAGGSYGIRLSSGGAIIGGTTGGAGNIIVNTTTAAVHATESKAVIQGNTIGQAGHSNFVGVWTGSDTDALIGGDSAAAGNTIAYATHKAVSMSPDSGLVEVRRNSIFAVGVMAIDLGNNGATPNDAGDADTGANGLQNFPLLLSADSNAGNSTTVTGVINTTAGTPLIIDFYSADVASNEARTWLGSKTIVTDGGGGASFTVNLPFVAGNKFIVATATNLLNAPKGVTSELSPAVTVVGPIDGTAPTVTNGTFEYQTGHAVKLVFSEELIGNSLSAGDLEMKNVTTNQTFSPTSFSYDAATKAVTFRFANALPDGNYEWTLPAGAVSDLGGNATTSPFNGSTFVLAGDFNRDRAVNFDDLLVLAQHYGQTAQNFGSGNATYDAGGKVDFDDLLLLAKNYGKSLTPAPAAVAESIAPSTRQRATSLVLN